MYRRGAVEQKRSRLNMQLQVQFEVVNGMQSADPLAGDVGPVKQLGGAVSVGDTSECTGGRR
jgi:hypothetical protein